jgi:hypothetical protein
VLTVLEREAEASSEGRVDLGLVLSVMEIRTCIDGSRKKSQFSNKGCREGKNQNVFG